jgi:apolipoprotein N-acyltransferase
MNHRNNVSVYRHTVNAPRGRDGAVDSIPPKWAESFLFAGSSAFLLLVANFFSDYWYFSFFALTPLLYRISRCSRSEGLRIGLLFGISFFSVLFLQLPAIALLPLFIKIIAGAACISLFCWLAVWTRVHWGLNPFIIGFLWIGCEEFLVQCGVTDGWLLLPQVSLSSPIIGNFSVLFGLIVVSFIIMFANTLLVLMIGKKMTIVRSALNLAPMVNEISRYYAKVVCYSCSGYFIPEDRGPPILIPAILS